MTPRNKALMAALVLAPAVALTWLAYNGVLSGQAPLSSGTDTTPPHDGGKSPVASAPAPASGQEPTSAKQPRGAQGGDHPDTLAGAQYSGRTLGGMAPGELAEFYRFQRLGEANRWLEVNGRTLAVMEDLFEGEEPAAIRRAADHIRDAAATTLSAPAADQFRTLVLDYVDYRQQLTELDRERNLLGVTPDEVDVQGSLTALQDRVFGAENAGGLFATRRQAMSLLSKHRETYGDAESVSREELRRLQEAYQALGEQGGS
jgi:hypothetical protein